MLEAVGSDGFESLRAVVQGFLDDGVGSELLLDDLEQIRPLVGDSWEDIVLDVMDRPRHITFRLT
jgi:hypothetical protein